MGVFTVVADVDGVGDESPSSIFGSIVGSTGSCLTALEDEAVGICNVCTIVDAVAVVCSAADDAGVAAAAPACWIC